MTGSNLRRTAGLAALSALFAVAALPSVAAAHPPQRILATDGAPAAHALIVDAPGNVHVAIERTDRRGIWYATNKGGSWQVQRITRNHDVEPAITVSRGTVIIAFARLGSDGESNGIFTATKAGPAWGISRETDGIDRKPSMDSYQGVVHLAFERDRYRGSLWYSRLGEEPDYAAGWCCVGAPSIQINKRGRPFLAFGHRNAAGMVLGRLNERGRWVFEIVDRAASRGPRLLMANRSTLGYFREGEGPIVRTWFSSQVNNVGAWGFRSLRGGGRPFDLVVEGDEVNAFTIGDDGTESDGRIIWTFFANDYSGSVLVRGPREVRSVEVERVGRGDGFIGTNVVIVYGRDDGVWTVS